MSTSNKYQTKVNLLYNVLTFVVNALIGLVIPSFLINKLGVGTYSLIPISMSITSFMLVVTISINGTLSRFLSMDFAKNISEVNRTFSTSFFTLIGIFVLILPITLAFLYNPLLFLNINVEDIYSARILFSCIICAFILNNFASLFNSIAYVKNRIDLRNIALIINRLGIIVFISILFVFGYVNVQAYGIAVLLSTVLSLIYSYFTAKKLYPDLVVKYNYVTKTKFKKLYQLGFWLIVNQVGVLLFLQTDILVVNNILGAEMSGIFGTLLQWSFLIRTLLGIVSGVLGPITLSLYATNQIDKLIELTKLSCKLLGLFAAFLSVLVLYFAEDILRIWLGQDFAQYGIILQLMVFHLGFNLSYSSIVNLNIAYNRVKLPGIVTLITGFLNVIMGVLLLKYTDLGLTGIAIAGCTSLTLKNFVFTPLYAARMMKLPLFTYIKSVFPSISLTLLGALLIIVFPSSNLNIHGYIGLGLYGLILAFILGVTILILLNAKDKKLLKEVLFSKLKKQR